MAGSLIKIDEEIVTSAVASVTLTGIDSTYDVYMVRINNAVPTVDNTMNMRTTTSGVADSDSQYDVASKILKANTSFANDTNTNGTQWKIASTVGTDTNEQTNHIIYLFNFNNASEYSFFTNENTKLNASAVLEGFQGGGVHTVAEANDGVNFFVVGGNIEAGTFTLYGLKK